MPNYTILHCHTMLSNGVTNIDSVTSYDQYIKQAHEWGMKAMALSEHGSVFQFIKKKLCMEEHGMKFIAAEEFYVTQTLSEKVRDNYHCLLIAKNYDGVLELNKLSSKSFDRGDNSFYYVPRITIEDVKNTSDNIIVSTACLGGILNKAPDSVKSNFIRWMTAHADRCFLEIQPHLDENQIAYNRHLWELSKQTGIPLLMCTDTHALNAAHVEGRRILQKAKDIHFDGEDKFHLEMLSYDGLVDLCRQQDALPIDVYFDAIEMTNTVADMVEPFKLDYSYKYPHLWGDDSENVLRAKIAHGIKWRGVDKLPNYQEYLDRIEYEMKAYIHNGAIDFMLLMEDIIAWCKTQDILVGYGRGSCNGSVIAYLLGITEMDSIKHGLNFDRFMNVERVSLADIDTDYPPSRIGEVKQYIFNKHGLHCADIVTFNTIALKGAVRDVCRALGKEAKEKLLVGEWRKKYESWVQKSAELNGPGYIEPMPSDLQSYLDNMGADAYLKIANEICNTVEQDEVGCREKYPDVFKYVDIVNGCVVSVGNHPCFTGDTLVYTDNGYLPIQDVKVRNNVLTHKNRWCAVGEIMSRQIDDIATVYPSGSLPIVTTPNHPFLVRHWYKERYKKHKGGVDTSRTRYYAPEWCNVDEIKKNDVIGYPVNSDEAIPTPFRDLPLDDENFWWLVGRYLGDGWIGSGIRHRIGYDNYDEYLTICCAHAEKEEITSVLDDIGFSYRAEKHTATYRIYIKNRNMLEYLRQFGQKADGKFVPNFVIDMPKNLLQGFFDGYMSADGSYLAKKNLYSFRSVSKKLILGMIQVVAKLYHRHCSITITPAHKEIIREREVSCKEKYNVSFTKDKRKLDRSFYEDGYIWCRIKRIEYEFKPTMVYNLSVLDDNSYTANNIVVHNCGMIVSDRTIDDRMGLFTTSTDDVPISQINMKEVDLQNYVKLDLLKLDTIELINETCKLAGIERLTPDNVNIYDLDVWNSIRDDTTCIFQWEGKIGDQYIKQLLSDSNIQKFKSLNPNIDYMTLLSIGNGAIRPAGASYRDDLANGVIRKSGNEAIDEFMKPTFGYLVFQCQIIQFLHEYCGYTMGEADVVRRHFAKKTGTDKDIPQIKAGFAKTMAERYDMSQEESDTVIADFIQVIIDASNYLFSLNHSQPYSYEGYVSGWLRYHYPLQFLTVALNINDGNEEKTNALTAYAHKVGIKIKSPRFRHSHAEYFCDTKENVIYKGLSSIKNMSASTAEALYSMRDMKFKNFVHFLFAFQNVPGKPDSRQLDILIKIGFFDEFAPVNVLLKAVEIFNKYHKCKTIKVEQWISNNYPLDILCKISEKVTEKTASGINNYAAVIAALRHTTFAPTTISDRIKWQVKYLGYSTLSDQSANANDWVVVSVDVTKYGTANARLYNIVYGVERTYKCNKKYWASHPFQAGDVIRASIDDKPKYKKGEDGGWVKTGETEKYLKLWAIMDQNNA